MSNKQLVFLFAASVPVMLIGNGLLPLLPVYSASLGAAPISVGLLLAVSYLALVLGSLAAGWLSSRFHRRTLIMTLGGVAVIPAVWLMGRVTSPWQLMALTAFVWYLGGQGLALINIVASMFAGPHERGRVFGILAMTQGVGAVLGGFTIGGIADRWGYSTLFTVLAMVSISTAVLPFFIEDKPEAAHSGSSGKQASTPLGMAFYMVVLASCMVGMMSAAGRFGTSVRMDELKFLLAAITGTAAIGGVVSIVATPLVGRLSDRFGRRLLLACTYVAGGAGLLMLSASSALWHFWLSVTLLSIMSYAGAALGAALITDLVPPEAVDKGMSLFSAAPYLGSIIGYMVTGLLSDQLGMPPTLMIFSAIGVAAIAALSFARPRRVLQPA